MSSRAELFITEEVRDEYQKEMDEEFGKGKWMFDVPWAYMMWYDIRDFPDEIEIDVLNGGAFTDDDDEKIGKVKIKIEKYIEKSAYGESYIEIRPAGLTIL